MSSSRYRKKPVEIEARQLTPESGPGIWEWAVHGMTKLVPAEDIESIVGVKRHPIEHWAKAVGIEMMIYILHSQECKDSGIDLRDCEYSLALDEGIDEDVWPEDEAVKVIIYEGELLPEVGWIL